jgi:DNA-binding XRE family transcriptional regulator/predicted RNase H-like HicB family nuclease
MRYAAVVTREGKNTLAAVPDASGCQTFAEPGESIQERIAEALQGWLEAELIAGRTPPVPRHRLPKGGIWVEVPPLLAVRIALKQARAAAGLTQAQLAKRVGVSQPTIAALEHPDSNPTIETLEKVARALGASLQVSIEPAGKRSVA